MSSGARVYEISCFLKFSHDDLFLFYILLCIQNYV